MSELAPAPRGGKSSRTRAHKTLKGKSALYVTPKKARQEQLGKVHPGENSSNVPPPKAPLPHNHDLAGLLTPAFLRRWSPSLQHPRSQALLSSRTGLQGEHEWGWGEGKKSSSCVNIHISLPQPVTSPKCLGICPPLVREQHLPKTAGILSFEAHGPQNHYPVDLTCVSTHFCGHLRPPVIPLLFSGTCQGRKAMAGGEARLPGHRLRDGPRAHGHLDPFLPLLSPGICQHIVLIWVQLIGVMQLHSGDQVCPKHLERERKGH